MSPPVIRRYFTRPAFWLRFTASRGPVAFFDILKGRDVWTWHTSDGGSYAGDSRFGVWIERKGAETMTTPRRIIEPLTTSQGERCHSLKCNPDAFGAVWSGAKAFEWRSTADREFRSGDFVRLREWIPASRDGKAGHFTDREIIARVPYVLTKRFGMPDGFAVLSLDVVARTRSSTESLEAFIHRATEPEPEPGP